MSKYFLVSNEKRELSKEDIAEAHDLQTRTILKNWENNLRDFQIELTKEKPEVEPIEGRVLVISDLNSKLTHRFENGTEISLARNFDNFNRRETQPVNGIVLSAKNIPIGSEIVMHHNAIDGNNELSNYRKLGEESNNVKYLSVPEYDCYLYREPNSKEWLPCEGFATALRCYMPYIGPLEGIKPERLKSRLLITSGKYKDKICMVAVGSDYQMCFQGVNGREENIIRLRTFDYENFDREEIIGIDDLATELYNQGEILVGLTPESAKSKK